MKVIVDTNLWISFLLHSKVSRQLLEIISRDDVTLVSSQLSIDELVAVASRKKFSKYINSHQLSSLVGFILKESLVFPLKDIPKRCRDPKDDYLLELAVVSGANYLLTGDDDLLSIKEIDSCEIMKITELYSKL